MRRTLVGIVVSTMATFENKGSRVSRRSFCISLLLPIFLASVSGNAFGQSCPHPNYPTAASTAIDSSCGPQGSGGDEATQNEAKNNFCASGEQDRRSKRHDCGSSSTAIRSVSSKQFSRVTSQEPTSGPEYFPVGRRLGFG
jgi:hypothetical protein